MELQRPVLISVAQYEQELKDGSLSVFDVIETAHRLDVDGVELRRETWPAMQDELAAARVRIEELGLLVTFATHVTLFSDNPDNAATVRRDIETASDIGSPQLRVFLGASPAGDQTADWMPLQDAVDHAASHNVVLALENYSGTPGGTLVEIQRALEKVQSPALATNIDIGNYSLHGEDIPHAIRSLGGRAVSAHLKDQTGIPGELPTYLGGGKLPLADIMAELNRLPQRILYCFEFRGEGEAEDRIRRSLRFLRES